MDNTFSDRLRNFILKNIPDAKSASGNKQITIRCRFCGDSKKDTNARHLYISLGMDGKPPMYHCFKCGTSGILTSKLISQWISTDVDDLDVLSELNDNIKDLDRKLYKSKDIYKKYNLYNNYISNTKISSYKLSYINKRLGLSLSYKEILNSKIVLNLLDLLDYNRISEYTKDIKSIKEINTYFIGFLSMDNSSVNLRRIAKEKVVNPYIDYRYINYNIFNNSDGINYYTIPSICDITKPINIHIAEGPFDILSVFYNINNGNKYQNIYTACKGKDYISAIRTYIKLFGIINSTFHIYIDNDIDIYPLKEYKDLLYEMYIDVYIHKNTYKDEKDYGVPLSRITDTII